MVLVLKKDSTWIWKAKEYKQDHHLPLFQLTRWENFGCLFLELWLLNYKLQILLVHFVLLVLINQPKERGVINLAEVIDSHHQERMWTLLHIEGRQNMATKQSTEYSPFNTLLPSLLLFF